MARQAPVEYGMRFLPPRALPIICATKQRTDHPMTELHTTTPNADMPQAEVVTACVLIIGNEILSGRTQDTNLNHIASCLGDWGIRTMRAEVIPDDADTIIEAVRRTSQAFDYVFTTGGIGPTHDDITAECIARAFNVDLMIHPEIESRILALAAPPEVMDSRMLMARVPEGARLIDNPTGGPQGFAIGNVHVMAGIPRVMQAMLSSLEGTLKGGAIVRSRSIIAYLGESTIATALGEIQSDFPAVDIGSYPFMRGGRYGTNLIMRGTDDAELDKVYQTIWMAVRTAGVEPEAGSE